MTHAYTGNFVHLVFSTKDRQNTISAEIQEKLWAYLFGTARKLKMELLSAGGTANHVHLLIALPPTITLSEAIQKLKANSSRWMGEHGVAFEWQKGYGAFSVSPSNLNAVRAYIRTQSVHHRKRSFEEEFMLLLKKSGISFDSAQALG